MPEFQKTEQQIYDDYEKLIMRQFKKTDNTIAVDTALYMNFIITSIFWILLLMFMIAISAHPLANYIITYTYFIYCVLIVTRIEGINREISECFTNDYMNCLVPPFIKTKNEEYIIKNSRIADSIDNISDLIEYKINKICINDIYEERHHYYRYFFERYTVIKDGKIIESNIDEITLMKLYSVC